MAPKARHTARQRWRGDAVPRVTPDMEASPWPGRGGPPGALPGGRDMPGFPAQAGPARAAAYALQNPAYFQPPSASTIRLQGRQSGQTSAAGEVVLATSQLQGGNLGVLRIVNAGVANLLASSVIIFRIRVAGTAVEGWQFSPFAVPVAVYQQEFPPESTLILIPEGAAFSLTSVVQDAGVYNIDMMVQGWRYGRELRDDFDNAWRAGVA